MTGPMQRIFRRRAASQVPPQPQGTQTDETTVLPAGVDPAEQATPAPQSFRDRGRMRRRLRYLRRARELGFRDLGGLVFDMRRFGRPREDLVEAKVAALANVDRELRALELALSDQRPFHELREAGIASCPACGALHGSEARFCPACGNALRGPRAIGGLTEGGTAVEPAAGGPPPPVHATQMQALPGAVPPAGTPAADNAPMGGPQPATAPTTPLGHGAGAQSPTEGAAAAAGGTGPSLAKAEGAAPPAGDAVPRQSEPGLPAPAPGVPGAAPSGAAPPEAGPPAGAPAHGEPANGHGGSSGDEQATTAHPHVEEDDGDGEHGAPRVTSGDPLAAPRRDDGP